MDVKPKAAHLAGYDPEAKLRELLVVLEVMQQEVDEVQNALDGTAQHGLIAVARAFARSLHGTQVMLRSGLQYKDQV